MKTQPLSQFWCFLTLLFLTCLPFSGATAATPTPTPIDTTQYLLVQHSASATLTHQAGEKTFTITLQDVSPYIAYFSDRPNRKAGTMSMEAFLKFWENNAEKGFKNDPPNAYFNAMEVGTPNSKEVKNFSVELTNPQYDPKTNTLSYTAQPLAGMEIPNFNSLNFITLFIDDVCLSCW
jgi:hypothetical protein